jgi:hypothetical protein
MRLPRGCAGDKGSCSIGEPLARITGQGRPGGLPWFNFFVRKDIMRSLRVEEVKLQ